MQSWILFLVLSMWLPALASAGTDLRPAGLPADADPGVLQVMTLGGEKPTEALRLPLKHTRVEISVEGFVARATVVQEYGNPFEAPIEAIYTFPLPNKAAVDRMRMRIGDKTIEGKIMRREAARKVYEQAKAAGKRAGLLEQERPNIFTQSLGNVMPGDEIRVEISYVEILTYRDEGAFELVFPMVVGPRYIPGTPIGAKGTGFAEDTDQVPDASRITPPVLKPGERSGQDISVTVELDAKLPIRALHSVSHAVDTKTLSQQRRRVELHPSDRIPSKDLVLRWKVAGDAPQFALIPHHESGRGGWFTLIALPQERVTDEQTLARDLIFIIDTSGSMRGRPMDQSKQAMDRLISGMRPTDRFNIVRFAGDSATLWSEPKPATQANISQARAFVEAMRGAGGTEIRKGVNQALAMPAEPGRLRIAMLLTDGYVSNEAAILDDIERERRGARVFALGVGSSVNRFLLDRVSLVGRGDVFYVRPDEDETEVVEHFFKRVDRPTLADIQVDWGGLDVTSLTPGAIPDLWQGQPLLIHGRYEQGGEATIRIRGHLGKAPFERAIRVRLPRDTQDNPLMAQVWARARVKELMILGDREMSTEKRNEAVTELGLEYGILTRWTSFVAVEEKVVNQGGEQKTVVQPVELPEFVDYEGVFGELAKDGMMSQFQAQTSAGTMTDRALLYSQPPAMPAAAPGREHAPAIPEERNKSVAESVPPTPCRIEALTVSGGLRHPQVRQRLSAGLAKLCKALKPAVYWPQTYKLRLLIAPDGSVKRLELSRKDKATPAMRQEQEELRKELRQLDFGKVPGGGSVQVEAKLVLRR